MNTALVVGGLAAWWALTHQTTPPRRRRRRGTRLIAPAIVRAPTIVRLPSGVVTTIPGGRVIPRDTHVLALAPTPQSRMLDGLVAQRQQTGSSSPVRDALIIALATGRVLQAAIPFVKSLVARRSEADAATAVNAAKEAVELPAFWRSFREWLFPARDTPVLLDPPVEPTSTLYAGAYFRPVGVGVEDGSPALVDARSYPITDGATSADWLNWEFDTSGALVLDPTPQQEFIEALRVNPEIARDLSGGRFTMMDDGRTFWDAQRQAPTSLNEIERMLVPTDSAPLTPYTLTATEQATAVAAASDAQITVAVATEAGPVNAATGMPLRDLPLDVAEELDDLVSAGVEDAAVTFSGSDLLSSGTISVALAAVGLALALTSPNEESRAHAIAGAVAGQVASYAAAAAGVSAALAATGVGALFAVAMLAGSLFGRSENRPLWMIDPRNVQANNEIAERVWRVGMPTVRRLLAHWNAPIGPGIIGTEARFTSASARALGLSDLAQSYYNPGEGFTGPDDTSPTLGRVFGLIVGEAADHPDRLAVVADVVVTAQNAPLILQALQTPTLAEVSAATYTPVPLIQPAVFEVQEIGGSPSIVQVSGTLTTEQVVDMIATPEEQRANSAYVESAVFQSPGGDG